MKELFLSLAPYITFVFIIALPPEVWRNFRTKTYASGTRISWLLRCGGYAIFGVYSVMIREDIVARAQFLALGLSLIILLQSFCYRHAK